LLVKGLLVIGLLVIGLLIVEFSDVRLWGGEEEEREDCPFKTIWLVIVEDCLGVCFCKDALRFKDIAFVPFLCINLKNKFLIISYIFGLIIDSLGPVR
jgi:hypothetical protein